jgi:hypothetical protein
VYVLLFFFLPWLLLLAATCERERLRVKTWWA